jgi:epoxyqueuosine reductase
MEIAAAHEVPSRHTFIELAHACGFTLAGVAPARPLEEFASYQQWVADGMAGPMSYLTDHRMRVRSDPRHLLDSARSVLCLGMLYNTEVTEPRSSRSGGMEESNPVSSEPPTSGRVSRYAWGSSDYHEVMRNSLEGLTTKLRTIWGDFEFRVCVDTAPLLERVYARAAGLGWIGRNTCLINEPLGSWFFLGEILISIELPPDSPPPDRCGTCTRCVDACPTQALVPVAGATGPEWQLDARLCISTLTIEQKGATPESTRAGTGDHLFGCDICQEVCPWNRRSPLTDEPAFQPLNARLDLAGMAALTRDEFRSQFRSTALWRTKFEGWMRNVATVMGNSGDSRFVEPLRALAQSAAPGVSEHADWALQHLERSAPAIEPGLKEQA